MTFFVILVQSDEYGNNLSVTLGFLISIPLLVKTVYNPIEEQIVSIESILIHIGNILVDVLDDVIGKP